MNKTLINALLVFVAGSSYGFIVPVIKISGGVGIVPASFLPLQYLVALIISMLALAYVRPKCPGIKSLAKLSILGVFTGATSICYYTAVSLLPSAVALTLLFQFVWISVLVESILQHKLPSKSSIIAIIIVLIGTVFAAGLFDGTFSRLDSTGIVFGLASALFYALFLYFSGRIEPEKPAVLRTAMLTCGGLLTTSLLNPSVYVTSFFSLELWPYAIGLAFLGILFPTLLINYASPKLSAGMVSIMASSELPVGIFAAWLLAGDTPSPLVLFGAILVLGGIVVKQLPDLYAFVQNRMQKPR